MCVCDTLALIFFFNDTATTEIYTLSLHDALPIFRGGRAAGAARARAGGVAPDSRGARAGPRARSRGRLRSEEHTSELQSRQYLVCRLLLEKKKQSPARVLDLPQHLPRLYLPPADP